MSERENIFCNFKKKIWNELFNRIIKNKNFFFYDSISSFFIKKSLKKICKTRRIFKGSNSFDRPISKRQSIFDALESLRSEADKSDPFIPGLEDDEIDFFGMSVNMNIIKQLVCLKFKYVTMLKNNFTYKNNWSESYKLFFKEFYLFCRALNVLKAKSNYNYRINTSRLHWIFNEKIKKMKKLKKKIKILKNQKNIINKKRPLLTKTFIESLFQSLYIFLNCKLKIQVTLNQINWYSTNIKKKEAKISKWYIWLSNWLKKNSFHKDSVNICYLCVKQKNPSFLIANLIATYFKTLKRQNFFLKFIRRSLSKQLRQKYSKINGIKIKLSGRFNKWPRARHKFIKIGKGIPVLSTKTKVDYSESTSYTPNGTWGIKVWTLRKKIYYKKNFKKLFNKRIN